MSGPKDIMDDTNFERLGFQIIWTELVIGLYSKFYKAKKDGKELIVKLITLESKCKLIYRPNLLNQCLKILLFIGGDESEAKSPHFVRVYEIFGLQNRICIFVEMFSKLLIYTTIKTRDTNTELDAKKRAKQMVEAIYTLQLCGIAHRNIRIQNVIFDKYMNIEIVDFGFAMRSMRSIRKLQERQTKIAEEMGKLAKVSGPKDIMDDTNFERLGF